jgi:hypothetical protein
MPSLDFISISIFIFSDPDVMMPAYVKSSLKINIEIDIKSRLGIGWHHYIWVTENKYRN